MSKFVVFLLAALMGGCISSQEVLFTPRDIEAVYEQNSFRLVTLDKDRKPTGSINVSRQNGLYSLSSSENIHKKKEGKIVILKGEQDGLRILAYSESDLVHYIPARLERDRIVTYDTLNLVKLAEEQFSNKTPSSAINPEAKRLLEPHSRKLISGLGSDPVPVNSIQEVRNLFRALVISGKLEESTNYYVQ